MSDQLSSFEFSHDSSNDADTEGPYSNRSTPSNSSSDTSELILNSWLLKPVEQLPLHPQIEVTNSVALNLTQKEVQLNSMPCQLEDIDLMPTAEDFMLCQRYFTRDGTQTPITVAFDADMFLRKFYTLAPAFRLTFCAFVADLTLTDELGRSYYKRARRALTRVRSVEPSLESVQTCTFLYHFCVNKGQPVFALQFLSAGLRMIVQLGLNIDPDDSPWLYPLNLSERQKEERRRCFWQLFWHWSWQKALSDQDAIDVSIDSTKVKPPGDIYDPFPIFSAFSTVKWECSILDLIGRIRKRYTTPPKTPFELLVSADQISLGIAITSTQSSIPSDILLMSSHPDIITSEEEKLYTDSSAIQECITQLNFMLHAATSVFYRPILVLSCLPAYNPILLRSDYRQIMASAIDQCLQSARRILSLLAFFQDVHSGKRGREYVLPADRKFYDPAYSQEPMFEAVLIIWLVSCRMHSNWWSFISCEPFDVVLLRERLSLVMKYLIKIEEVEGASSGNIHVFHKCVGAMLREIDHSGPLMQPHDEVRELEIGMKVISLDGEGYTEAVSEPWAFIGLLGIELPGGIRWKGRSEESWRLFWKLYT